MKRLVLVTITIALLATPAFGRGFGVRAGVSVDPDQFHFGAHYDVGHIGTNLRLVPNVEIGLGDNHTLVCLDGDVLYDFPGSRWSVGGELGINFWNRDVPAGAPGDGSDTDVGLSALGNYRFGLANGHGLMLEAKLGLIDSPDFKFTVGYTF